MQKLSKTHRANGYNYTQVMRTEKKAMYKSDGEFWEVFRIKIAPARKAFGKEYPEREIYPGNEDFGKWAWCHSVYENALKCYNNL